MAKPPAAEELFPELSSFRSEDFNRIGTSRPVLMIAMTARTGSSHLCSGLSSVVPVGKPTEIFNARDTLVWEKKRRGVETFSGFLADYVAESEDIVVFKTSWIDFEYFKDHVFDLFPNLRIIYLNRLDVEAQAVSLFKAVVSGLWHDSPIIAKPREEVSCDELEKKFDLVRICGMINSLNREKASWESYFFENEVQPARVNYESFTQDLKRALSQIVTYLGYKDVDLSRVKSEFSVVSDSINNRWLDKVRNYRSGNFYDRYLRGEL